MSRQDWTAHPSHKSLSPTILHQQCQIKPNPFHESVAAQHVTKADQTGLCETVRQSENEERGEGRREQERDTEKESKRWTERQPEDTTR